MAAVELQEVVGLQGHVVELQKAQRLPAFQPLAHRVHGDHAIDREMPADVAQEVDMP